MSTNSSAAITTPTVTRSDRALDTPEFVKRLAEDQRVKSGSDLPLSCFIEQVKMQLKGRPVGDMGRTAAHRAQQQAASPAHHTSELFHAWAMPD